jgi:2-(3-amino-3-carboxypropyl)histidine synthase
MNRPSLYCSFYLDLDDIANKIKHSRARTVGLQFPEGLKRSAFFIAGELEKRTSVNIIISGNPCYGACDVDMELMRSVDVLFHFGHSELVKGPDNVIYIETPARTNIKNVLAKAIAELGSGTIGLVTTVQHVHRMDDIKAFIRSKGISYVVGTGDSRIKYPGQILGCNFSAADIPCDQYLYIGSGTFHPLGIAIATKRKVLCADPMTTSIEWVDPDKILRTRCGIIEKCHRADTYGILISTKIGQNRAALAQRMAVLAEKYEKKYIMISLDNITPDALMQFKMNAFVNTACPRIAIDNAGMFSAPVLTPVEFEIALGHKDWNEYVFDEIRD